MCYHDNPMDFSFNDIELFTRCWLRPVTLESLYNYVIALQENLDAFSLGIPADLFKELVIQYFSLSKTSDSINKIETCLLNTGLFEKIYLKNKNGEKQEFIIASKSPRKIGVRHAFTELVFKKMIMFDSIIGNKSKEMLPISIKNLNKIKAMLKLKKPHSSLEKNSTTETRNQKGKKSGLKEPLHSLSQTSLFIKELLKATLGVNLREEKREEKIEEQSNQNASQIDKIFYFEQDKDGVSGVKIAVRIVNRDFSNKYYSSDKLKFHIYGKFVSDCFLRDREENIKNNYCVELCWKRLSSFCRFFSAYVLEPLNLDRIWAPFQEFRPQCVVTSQEERRGDLNLEFYITL